jgi:multiple sugar transport system ATP-binding protein
MASVELIGISKSFGAVEAVRDVTLKIADREFVVLLGPSGCGKSTLLRMIAGLEEISAGELRIGGRRMNEVPAADRGIAMVFQSYALYPHMSVAENMGFGLRMAGMHRAAVAEKVRRAAEVLQIGDLLGRKPRALSGGQRQRVALGRAITRNPDVFLFDEPLSSLDAGLRVQMRLEIARLHRELSATMIYVTHDQVEAMTLADRIVVLDKGRIEQHGNPLELYDHPANLFVAGFLGQPKINLLTGSAEADGQGTRLRIGPECAVPLPAQLAQALPAGEVTLGLRPDAVRITPRGTASGLPGQIEMVEMLGSETVIHARLDGYGQLLTATVPGKAGLVREQPCEVAFEPDRLLAFDARGQRIDWRLRPTSGRAAQLQG